MRPKHVFILALVFSGLLVVTLLERVSTGVGADEAIAMLPVRPSQMNRIESKSDGDVVVLERGGDGWAVRDQGTVWPADASRVSSGLRVLTGVAARRADDRGELLGGMDVGFVYDGGAAALTIAGKSLSGLREAELNGEPVRLSDDIASVLTPESLRAWRDTAVMPELDGGIRRIRVHSLGSTLELSRVGSRWGLVQPVRTPADSGQVAALIGTLAGLESAHVQAEVAAGADALEIEIEAGAYAWRVRSDSTGRGERLWRSNGIEYTAPVALDAASLAGLRIDAGSLVAKVAFSFPRSDVRGLVVDGAVIQREGRGWSRDAQAVDGLLEILTATPCSAVVIGSPSSSSMPIALTRFGDLPAFKLWVEISDASLGVSDGAVTRVYGRDDDRIDEVAAWLSGLGR